MQRDSGSTRIFKLFSSCWFLSLQVWGCLREEAGVSRDQETDLLRLFVFLRWKLLTEKQRQEESEVLKEILCSLSKLPNVLIISCH